MGQLFQSLYLNIKTVFLSYYFMTCYMKGQSALRNKQYKKAAAYFSKPLNCKDIEGCLLDQLFLKDFRATLNEQVGDICCEYLHDYQKALRFYDQSAQLDTRQVHMAYFKMAKIHDELNQMQEAQKYYQAALDASPQDNFWYHFHLGDVLKRQGQYQEAISYFREAARIEPQKEYWLHGHIGEIYNKDLRNYDEAIKTVKQSLLGHKEEKMMYIDNMYLGTLYWKKGEMDQALEAMEDAIAINPKGAGMAYEGAADIYFSEHQDYDKGIEVLREAVEINPDNHRAYVKWGMALLKSKRLEEAVGPLEQAVNRNTKQYMAYFALGCHYFNQEDYRKAYELFHKALALAPADKEIMENLNRYMAHTLKQIGYSIEARDHFEKVLGSYSKDKDAYYNLGLIYCGREKFDKGIQMMQRIVNLYPNESDSYVKLGTGYELSGQYERAMVQYNHAISLNPDSKEACMGLARSFAYRRIWHKVIDNFQKAMELDSNDDVLPGLTKCAREAMSGNYESYKKLMDSLEEQKIAMIKNTSAARQLKQGFSEFVERQVDFTQDREKTEQMIEGLYKNKIQNILEPGADISTEGKDQEEQAQETSLDPLQDYCLQINGKYEYGKEHIAQEYTIDIERGKQLLWEKIFDLFPDYYGLIRKELERYPHALWNFAACESLRQTVIAKQGLNFELSFLIILCYKGIEGYLQEKINEIIPDCEVEKQDLGELRLLIEKNPAIILKQPGLWNRQVQATLEKWIKFVRYSGAHHLTVSSIEEVNQIRQETHYLLQQLCMLFK